MSRKFKPAEKRRKNSRIGSHSAQIVKAEIRRLLRPIIREEAAAFAAREADEWKPLLGQAYSKSSQPDRPT
jgi:hypothetical protein